MCAMPSLTYSLPPRQSMRQALKGTWADRLLLLALLTCIAAAWYLIQAAVAAGPVVADIYHGDTLLASYPLPQQGKAPIHFHVEGELGLTEVVIDAHGARIVSSPCATQRCVLSGAHQHAGDMIACVPNRVLVALRGSGNRAFDAVVE